jgi:phytanoyl-CoA hydroxylase
MTMNMTIDAARYRADGYLVVPELFRREDMPPLLDEALAICRGERGAPDGLIPGAANADAHEAMGRYMVCVRPHKLSPRYRALLGDARLVRVLNALIGANVKCVHSQVYFKAPGMPGNAWHQDENFLPTRDRSLVTAWIALEDVTRENGCLRVFRGSHQPSVLYPMRPHNDPVNLDRAEICYGFPYAEEDAVALEMKAGSVVFFDGYLLHSSYPNRSADQFRRSLLFVYMNAASTMPWSPRDYATTNIDMRDIVMVAGEDPYAWKGVSDEAPAYLRPAGATTTDRKVAEAKPWKT